MASDYTREWIHFFRGCGIPDDVAERYGLIFNENRIQKNMLLDLNKEYLRDMGITVMGDIIAILRQAKIVHDKFIREQILSTPEGNPIPGEKVPVSDSPTKKSTPVKRMLEHYTRKNDTYKFNSPPDKVQICIENENAAVNVSKNSADKVGAQNKVKQKIEAPSMKTDDLPPGKPEVSGPTIRRVLPEKEGNYTIQMPTGITDRSKKILEKGKPKKTKTVFDRLGESSVSSTSDVSTTSESTIQTSKVPNKEKNTVSVFSRLGEKTPIVSSTSSNGNTIKISDQLPYKGILKSNTVKKLKISSSSTMRADNEVNFSSANNPSLMKTSLVKERLGTGVNETQSSKSVKGVKLKRTQITTTIEEKAGSGQVRTSLNSLKSQETDTGKSVDEKKNPDGLGRFRSETLSSKSKVTNTIQLSNTQRIVKRRSDETETPDSQVSDVTQSKKVRFGRTTHRLIPANNSDSDGGESDSHGLTSSDEERETLKTTKVTLKSGLRIRPMNSDKITERISMKERIGLGSHSLKSKMATNFKKKNSWRFGNRFERIVTVHDRLG